MPDYVLLMHGDLKGREQGWPGCLARLRAAGCFKGDSAIGAGVAYRKGAPDRTLDDEIIGFVRVSAAGLADAEAMLAGNPAYEAGGTVEIRLLPADDA